MYVYTLTTHAIRQRPIPLKYPHTGKICQAPSAVAAQNKKLDVQLGRQADERMPLVEEMGPNLVSPGAGLLRSEWDHGLS